MYQPTFEEEYNCRTGHSSCEYGICSECTVGCGDTEEDDEDVEE